MKKQLNGNFLIIYFFIIVTIKLLLFSQILMRYYNLGFSYSELGKKKEALERLILILFNSLVFRIAGS